MAKKAFISLTGGLNDVDRPDTLEEDQLQECVNYEIAGVGRLKKRTAPSVYDADLNTLLADVFLGGVNSISEPFYPPLKPENMTGDFIILVDGISDEDRKVEAFYEGAGGWIYQDGDGLSFFDHIDLPEGSQWSVNFKVSSKNIIIFSKDMRSMALSVDSRTSSISVNYLGSEPPSNKPVLIRGTPGSDYMDFGKDVEYADEEGIGSPGLIQCQYTVVDFAGNESNPSPLSDTLFAQAFKIGDDGISDEIFIESFKVYDLSVPDVSDKNSEDYEFFNIYYRIMKYSDGDVLDSMEFSKQVKIINKTFGVYDTGNDYLIQIPKEAGNIISYERDLMSSMGTLDESGDILMSGDVSLGSSSLPGFSFVAPITIAVNGVGSYVDAIVALRLNWEDFKDASGEALMPEWNKWFDNSFASYHAGDGFTANYPQGAMGATFKEAYFSRHIRVYGGDQTTPLSVLVSGVYDAEGNLDILVKIPLLTPGSNFIYLAWNDITEAESDLELLGFNEKYDLMADQNLFIAASLGYLVDADGDGSSEYGNRYGWYNNMAFHYGRFCTVSDPKHSNTVYRNDLVREGGSEFIANFYAKGFGNNKDLDADAGLIFPSNVKHLPNMANLNYPGQAVSTLEARVIQDVFAHAEYRAEEDGVSVDDLYDAVPSGLHPFNIATKYIGIADWYSLNPDWSDNYLYTPMLGVSTADPNGYLRVTNHSPVALDPENLSGGLLPAAKEQWKDISHYPMSPPIRKFQPILSNDTTIYNNWDDVTESTENHQAYGAFLNSSSGFSMDSLAQNIGDIPEVSFTRVKFSFRIIDLLKFHCDKLSTAYGESQSNEGLIDSEGWTGGEFGKTFYSYLKVVPTTGHAGHGLSSSTYTPYPLVPSGGQYLTGHTTWMDWVIFHWAAGDVDTDNESDTWGNVLGGVESSPIHNRGILLLEIRRTGNVGATGAKRWEMLLTYSHYADQHFDTADYQFGGFKYSKVRKSIVISNEFEEDEAGFPTYTGSDYYKHLDIILSTNMGTDTGYLYCIDKKFTDASGYEVNHGSASTIHSLEFSLIDFIYGGYGSGTASVNGTNYYKSPDANGHGGAVLSQTSWKGKKFYDIGIGVSKGLNIINKLDVDGVSTQITSRVVGTAQELDIWEQVTLLPGDDIMVRPPGAQTFIRYSAAHGFISAFEFNSSKCIDTIDMAYAMFYEFPLSGEIGQSFDGSNISYNSNISINKTYRNSNTSLNRNMIKWSEVGKQSFPDLNYKLLKEPIKRVIAAPSFLQFEYSNTFLIFTRNTINRFVLKGEASGWSGSSDSLIEENTQFGLYADNTLTKVGKEIFWLSEEGVIRWSPDGMINISKNVINVGDADGLYDADLYSAMYCPVRNQYILQYITEKQSFVYDLTYRMWTTFDGLAFDSSAILSGGSQAENVNLILNENEIFSYPGSEFTEESAHIRTKDIFLDAGKVDRVRLQYIGETNATLTCQLNGESRNGDAYDAREHTISDLKANVWRGAGNLGFGRMANIKVEDVEEIHSIMFDVKLKGGE